MSDLVTVENAIALLTLTSLEVVLGIDNVVFIAILTARLPPEQQGRGRRIGLALAMVSRRDEVALAEARARDALRALTPDDEPLAGMVLGVKACFDVRGWTTHAGSRVLADAPAASRDAALVRGLRRAGGAVGWATRTRAVEQLPQAACGVALPRDARRPGRPGRAAETLEGAAQVGP